MFSAPALPGRILTRRAETGIINHVPAGRAHKSARLGRKRKLSSTQVVEEA